jgi:hypothetical protein
VCKAPLPTHTHTHTQSGTSKPDCLGLILRTVAPPPFLCTLCEFYSRGSGGGPQPVSRVDGSLGCVLGWPMDSLSYGRRSHCARARLFAFSPVLVGTELGR